MDEQIRCDAGREAKRRFKENLPVNLRQLALALEIGYDRVLLWKKMPGFPYEHRLIFPEDFTLWRQRRFGLDGASSKTTHPAKSTADIETLPPPRSDVYASLPAHAQRLYDMVR